MGGLRAAIDPLTGSHVGQPLSVAHRVGRWTSIHAWHVSSDESVLRGTGQQIVVALPWAMAGLTDRGLEVRVVRRLDVVRHAMTCVQTRLSGVLMLGAHGCHLVLIEAEVIT